MIQEKGTVLLGHGELASDTDDESRDAGRARVTFSVSIKTYSGVKGKKRLAWATCDCTR